MTRPLALVCDDDPSRGERWRKAIAGMPGMDRFDIRPLSGKELTEVLDALNARRDLVRNQRQIDDGDAAVCVDQADIVLIDYDLTPDERTLTKLGEDAEQVREGLRGRSGETVAYLARGFTTAGFLVVVNQRFNEPTFDVTLQRFSDSLADLNVTGTDLEHNTSLWSGKPPGQEQISPWSWPILSAADKLWANRLSGTSLDGSVLEAVGLLDAALDARQEDLLSELVSTPQSDLRSVTFRDLTKSSLGLDAKDSAQPPDDEYLRALAASVVSRWLEHTVLSAQNVLIDLPHLISRFPSILGERANDPDVWHAAAKKSADAFSIAPNLERIQPVAPSFLSRPAWAVPQVREIAASLDPVDVPDLVFCEDTSRFIPLEEATEVETDVPGRHSRRFVELVSGVRYDPMRRVLGAP